MFPHVVDARVQAEPSTGPAARVVVLDRPDDREHSDLLQPYVVAAEAFGGIRAQLPSVWGTLWSAIRLGYVVVGDESFVEFGASGRRGLGTWAQQQQWVDLAQLGPQEYDANVMIDVPVANPIPLPEAYAAIRALVERHEALRTRYELARDGVLWQDVAASGRVPVQLVVSAEPEDSAHELRWQLWESVFDHARDLSSRFGLVTDGINVSHLLLVASHLSCDEGAGWVLRQEIELLLAGASVRTLPPPRHPLDIADRQQSPTAIQASLRSLEYLRRTMAAATPTMFPEGPAEGQTPRFWHAQLESIAISRAVDVLAARHRISPTNLLTAATAKTLAGLHKNRECTLRFEFNNRIGENAEVVGTLTQFGLASIAVDHPTFAETATAASRACLLACRYAEYDFLEFQRTKAAVEQERGTVLELDCWINIHAPTRIARDPMIDHSSSSDIGILTKETTFTWTHQSDHNQAQYYLHVIYSPERTELAVDADTRYLSPGEIEDCLRGTERVLLEAVAEG